MTASRKQIYLTIDDSPGQYMAGLLDFLRDHDVPSLIYVRGDKIEQFGAAGVDLLLRAIDEGHVIGNHLYHHRHAHQLSYDDVIRDIEMTQNLIDDIYAKSGQAQPVKTLRFPHIDRGCGSEVVDFNAPINRPFAAQIKAVLRDGVRLPDTKVTAQMLENKTRLQAYLADHGYVQPFTGITHDFFAQSEMACAYDSLLTYSTADWMATARHAGKWPYQTSDDLIQKIDDCDYLNDPTSRDVVLMHDDRLEDITPITIRLITHFLSKNVEFISV